MDNHTEILLKHVKQVIETSLTADELRLVSDWADTKRYAIQRELAARFK
jgi:hypothetical protein